MPALEADAERYRTLEQDHRVLTRPAADIIAWRNGRPIRCAEFLADVASCAERLPHARYLINLCADRYRFSVSFFAAAVRGQTTLLPSQRNLESIAELRESYGPSQVIADDPETHCDSFIDFAPAQNGEHAELFIEPAQIAAIAFTSGSTGKPSPHPKSWALLCAGRATHARYLARSTGPEHVNAAGAPLRMSTTAAATASLNGLVATVPSWHMYGLEWAMMLPTIAPVTLFCGADFFPSDVVAAFNSFGGEAARNILVSTPVHLRALLKSPAPARAVARTLSATAPLDLATAEATEAHLRTGMVEIYGCSEIGSLAMRQYPAHNDWRFFDIFRLKLSGERLEISTPLLEAPVSLADRFGPANSSASSSHQPIGMQLLGRATDLVKVAGKRESLVRLNNELLSLPGVTDGIVYQPEALGIDGGERLRAFVVGRNLDPAVLRSALASKLDPAFVPRPIRVVDELPRDATSKLKMSSLKELIKSVTDG